MSLILDALNRADRERKNTQVTPDINTVHEVTYRPEAAPTSKKILPITVLVLFLAVIWLAYTLLQNRSTPDLNQQRAPVVQSEPSIASATRAAAVVDEQPAQAEEVPAAPQPEVLPGATSAAPQIVATAPPPAEVNSLYAQEKPAAKVETPAAVNDLYKPVEEPAVVKSVALEPQTITPVSLVEKSTKTYAVLDVPDLSELPEGLQKEIPTIIYSQHNFTADGISNVVLNGQPRLAQTMIADQLSLDEIYVDGILLRFREHKFKLRALNNWVNM